MCLRVTRYRGSDAHCYVPALGLRYELSYGMPWGMVWHAVSTGILVCRQFSGERPQQGCGWVRADARVQLSREILRFIK